MRWDKPRNPNYARPHARHNTPWQRVRIKLDSVLTTGGDQRGRKQLQVNANAVAGNLTVDAALKDGQPSQGYAAADCVPLRADEVRHVVRWDERDRLPAERPISLRLRLRDTEPYSFRLQD